MRTAYENEWNELSNGALLAKAEENGFDLLLTTDQNLRYQQNISGRRIAILVLPTTNWNEMKLHTAEIAARVERIQPGEFVELSWD